MWFSDVYKEILGKFLMFPPEKKKTHSKWTVSYITHNPLKLSTSLL